MTEDKNMRAVQELTGKIVRLEGDLAAMTDSRDGWKRMAEDALRMMQQHTKGLTDMRTSLRVSGSANEGGINFPHKEDI